MSINTGPGPAADTRDPLRDESRALLVTGERVTNLPRSEKRIVNRQDSAAASPKTDNPRSARAGGGCDSVVWMTVSTNPAGARDRRRELPRVQARVVQG